MNRIEFLAELEKLLQDISAEERKEAVQYYKDYFEDAGLENEQHIIEELGSPKKVAETIKAGLKKWKRREWRISRDRIYGYKI